MYKVSIPQPCHEKWEQMTPQSNGAFCGQCSKVVVDFTQMSDEEVQNYLVQHAHEKLCGRFSRRQVENIRIEIPAYLFSGEMSFFKKFVLITLVVFGTTLYSCTSSSGKQTGTEFVVHGNTDTIPGGGHTIGKIAAPVDTTKKSCNKQEEYMTGYVVVVPADSIKMGEAQIVSEQNEDTVKKCTNNAVMGAPKLTETNGEH